MNATPRNSPAKTILRHLACLLFISAGISHFLKPKTFQAIVPPSFPNPKLLVIISGIAEIAGGTALQIPQLRRPAGIGLVALLIAVFPANIFMATHPTAMPSFNLPTWLLWARLPLQPVMIAWVWHISIKSPTPTNKHTNPVQADLDV